MQKKIVRLIYKNRGLLMVPPVVFMVLCTWKEIENDALVFGLGGIVFGMGLCLRIWSQMHLHHRLKVHKILTTTGPYVYIRNPFSERAFLVCPTYAGLLCHRLQLCGPL